MGKNAGDYLLAEQPLEERKGEMTDRNEQKTLTFSYEREDEDGLITFKIHNQEGKGNGILWLVVEEKIGFPPAGSPAVLRTAIRLAMIGIEQYWSPAYFAYKKYCEQAAGNALANLIKKAKTKKKSIPSPDPAKDRSLIDYVTRLQRQLRIK